MNSYVKMRVSGTGGQGGNAQQSQSTSSSATATNNGVGNGNNSNNTTVFDPRQVATAYSPTIVPTAPCTKGYGAGGQAPTFGFSLGGSKVDDNCDIREEARLLAQMGARLAACKVAITEKTAKRAGVTLEDCEGAPPEPRIIVEQGPARIVEAPQPPVITVNVPAPVVTIIPQPVPPAAPNVVTAAQKEQIRKATVRHPKPCVTNDTIQK